jgi:hypothetical protein
LNDRDRGRGRAIQKPKEIYQIRQIQINKLKIKG